MHFNFKVEWDKDIMIEPSLIGIGVLHPTHPSTTNFLTAKYDPINDEWNSVFDIGDPVFWRNL